LLFEFCVCVSTLADTGNGVVARQVRPLAASTKCEALIAGFRERAAPVSQTVTDCPAPKDNIFLALADTAQAEMLISSDPHLVDMHLWRGISILPPATFLLGIR
jgi:predicted nucleic acid-binding protein